MIKHLLYIALASSLLALAACNDDVVVQENNNTAERSPIELSVGIADAGFDAPATRAVVTDGTSKTLRAFEKDTRLFFMMVAEDGNTEAGHTTGTTLYGYNYGKAAGQASPADGSKSAVTHPDDNWLYWDDAYARDTKVSIYSIAANCKMAEAARIGKHWDGNNAISPYFSISTTNKCFNFGATSGLTINSADNRYWTGWSIGTEITWTDDAHPGTASQDKSTFEAQDLVFSNNIANYDADGTDATKDKRLKFNTEAGEKYRKFDKGELIYYHALSKFTIKIKCGDGFKGDGTDFKFTDGSGTACTTPDNSFAINDFYGRGDFNLKTGEFESHTKSPLKVNYTSIYLANTTQQKKDAGEYYTLNAYVLPGTDMTNVSGPTNAFSFIIDGNKYDITLGQLYNAIKTGATNVAKQGASPTKVDASILGEESAGDGGKYLLAGVNYEFTFTVEKTKISGLTAQVVDWENVVADNITPSNARISLKLEERGSEYMGSDVEFYRTADGNGTVTDTYEGYNWTKGYEKNYTSKSYDGITHKWTFNDWYWPDNTTYYHFRAVGDRSANSPVAATVTPDDANGDYFSLAAGESYHDYIWGAPMLDDGDNETDGSFKFYYNTTNGFDATGDGSPSAAHQIYKGIGPTNATVKLLMFHMMSDVTFKVKTTTETDAVSLGDGTDANCTKIELKSIKTSGTALVGNGLVSATGDATDYSFTAHPTPSSGVVTWANYGAIPQSLQDVILVITTPDKNRYEVAMKDVKVASSQISSNNIANPYAITDGKCQINYWYPGFKYTYNLTLKKKGINDITATILDWETVEAEEDDIQIK